jgi:hypothetical protein
VADAGLSPTHWQASTFPEPFRSRISVIHDGIDTRALAPNPHVTMSIRTTDGRELKLGRADEVVTFVNRNLEPYRGYHVFMRALPELLRTRPKARVLIVGGNDVSYGARPPEGKTWKDISEYGTVDYTSTLDESRGDNILRGRRAYANKSPGYPDQWVSSRIKVDLKTKPESVQVRFFHASGTGFSGAPGWEIDMVELIGASSTPFWSFVAHADQCDPKGPSVSAGEAITVKSKQAGIPLDAAGTHPEELPLTYTWTQVEGPAVSLVSDGAARVTFDAPDVGKETVKLSFEVRADDGTRLSPLSRVDVTVVPADPTRFEASGGGCTSVAKAPRAGGAWRAAGLLALSLAALGVRRLRRR